MKKVLVLIIIGLCVGAVAHAETFDFEDVDFKDGADMATSNNSYNRQGFRFTATHFNSLGDEVNEGYLSWWQTGSPSFNTSTALFNSTLYYNFADNAWTNFYGSTGQVFNFESIDLDHFLNPATAGYDVSFLTGVTEFYGYDASGNEVGFASVPFSEGWETYTFDATFENLSKVRWRNLSGFELPNGIVSVPQFDNVNVTVTPEPVSSVLFGVGGLGLWVARRKRK